MQYKDFNTDDFLEDEFFVNWVKSPTPESDYFWKKWMDNHPDKSRKIAAAKDIILSVHYKNSVQPTDTDLLEALENIHKGKTSQRAKTTVFRQISWPVVFRYAAILVILISLGMGLWLFSQSQNQPEQIAQNQKTLILKKTLQGQKLKVVLPDGSEVKLNAESAISYDIDFGYTNRNIQLEGEAFFDVKHDPSKPFTIQTENLKTTVLGTAFNINAYPNSNSIQVAVLRGKVGVSRHNAQDQEEENFLLPKEMLTYEKDKDNSHLEVIELADIFSWKDDIIYFQNADYQKIKKTLERWYSVSFQVDGSMEVKEEFSGKFENTSLERVLDALNYTSNFHYELKNSIVHVTRKNEP